MAEVIPSRSAMNNFPGSKPGRVNSFAKYHYFQIRKLIMPSNSMRFSANLTSLDEFFNTWKLIMRWKANLFQNSFFAMDSSRDRTHTCLERHRNLPNVSTLKLDAYRKFPMKIFSMAVSAIKISIRKSWSYTRRDTAWRLIE